MYRIVKIPSLLGKAWNKVAKLGLSIQPAPSGHTLGPGQWQVPVEEGVSSSNWSTQKRYKDLGLLAEALHGPGLMSKKDKGSNPEREFLMWAQE